MEERTKLIASITDVVDNTRILQEWMIEENTRLKHEGQMAYAREDGMAQVIQEGIEQGSEKNKKEVIINMLNLNIDYNVTSQVTGKTIEEIKK